MHVSAMFRVAYAPLTLKGKNDAKNNQTRIRTSLQNLITKIRQLAILIVKLKMRSIKEKLDISLIFVLIAISLLFMVYMIGLHSFGSSLTPEAYAQIISALATTLVVILTLGLRLIDDALNRYEKVAKPRIISLQLLLGATGTKNELTNCHPFNLPSRSQDLIRTSSDLKKYGRFFLTKLYPQESLNEVARISSDLDEFLALMRDMEPYWEKSDFDTFLNFSIGEYIFDSANLSYIINLQKAREAIDKLNREKPELINQMRKLRERILLEIEKVIDELGSFLEAN